MGWRTDDGHGQEAEPQPSTRLKIYRGEPVSLMVSQIELEIVKDAFSIRDLRGPAEAIEYLRKLEAIIQEQIDFHGGQRDGTERHD